MFIVYTTLVLLNAHLAFCRVEWVDPHDMVIKDTNNLILSEKNNHQSAQARDCPMPINFSMAHYKRLINLLLGAVAVDESDTANFKGHLYINMAREQYDLLRQFAKSTEDVEDPARLRQMDQVLSKILTKPTHARLAELLISWTDHIYFTFYNRTTGILAVCVFLLFISYKLLRANLTIWSVAKYLIFLGWVTDFAFTWINLLQEAEINKMADSLQYQTVPPFCDPNQMTFWQYLVYSVSSKSECRSYHQTMYKDHFWSIAPVTVLSHQLGVVIYTPASHIGQALGSLTAGLLSSLPWGINIVLLPVLLIFLAIILCIVFSFLTQTSFGFNFLHVLQLRFGNEERRAVGDVLTGRNLTALLNMAHRSMIEDVRQSNSAENSVTLEDSHCSSCSNKQSSNPAIQGETSGPSESSSKNVEVELAETSSPSKSGKEDIEKLAQINSADGCNSENKCLLDAGRSDDVGNIISITPHDGSGDRT